MSINDRENKTKPTFFTMLEK